MKSVLRKQRMWTGHLAWCITIAKTYWYSKPEDGLIYIYIRDTEITYIYIYIDIKNKKVSAWLGLSDFYQEVRF